MKSAKKIVFAVLSIIILITSFSFGAFADEVETATTDIASDDMIKENQTSDYETDTETDKAESNVILEEDDENKLINITSSSVLKNDNGGFILNIEVKNTSDSNLKDVKVFISKFDDEEVEIKQTSSFYDYQNGYVYYCAELDSLNIGETRNVLFELNKYAPKSEFSKIDIVINYYINGESVYAGNNNPASNIYESFSDILAPKESVSKLETVKRFVLQTGFAKIGENWKSLIMIAISFALIYLAIVKKFEPLLLLPIAFGMLLTNLPGAEMFHENFFANGHVHWEYFSQGGAGLLDYLYLGVKLGIYPCLIFLGIGAMTDFGPLIANPKSLLLGAAAQLGIFITYLGANLLGFTSAESASIGIIGGADGPTAIYVTSMLSPSLLGPIAVAAYSYMALVPFIQPPIMRALTTKAERKIVMKELRPVSKTEKILFPIAVTVFVAFLVPSATPLVGCLMLGNLMKESGVVERICKTAQNELMNIVTIFLGISVGATATANTFLSLKTMGIMLMGIIAFSFGSAGGVLLAKFLNLFTKNKINPLIGSAGVSAVPMAARVSQTEGQKEDPSNYLLMHAMGPNVAGVIGSAIAAGVLIALFA